MLAPKNDEKNLDGRMMTDWLLTTKTSTQIKQWDEFGICTIFLFFKILNHIIEPAPYIRITEYEYPYSEWENMKLGSPQKNSQL